MVLRLPRAAEREYLAIYGIVAVYVAALPFGNAQVGITRDLLHSLLALRREFSGTHITCAYWVKDRDEARLIARQVNHDLLSIEATPSAAKRCVESAAARMNIPLTEHDTVLLRARSAVAYIEQKIDEAQANGELSWFNREYRAWRIEAKQHGRSMSYAQARARLRRQLYRDILSNPVQRGLFPPLPTLNLN